jgi:HSP20 family protein
MAIFFRDPFESLRLFQNALERQRSTDWFGAGTASTGAYPPVNVFQQEDGFVVVAELPGVDKADLDIQVKDKRVRISGKRAIDYGEGASMHRRERVSGSFDRTFAVPVEIDAERVKAEYRDGILAIRLVQSERSKPRSVAID